MDDPIAWDEEDYPIIRNCVQAMMFATDFFKTTRFTAMVG